MSELQATIELSVELCKFYNVDLFQRGLYQVRCGLRVPPKQPVQTEVSIPETGKSIGTASVLGNGGACRPFQILYRNEEITLQDMILFRCHLLVDSRRLREALERAEFSLVIELWFSEQPHQQMMMVSTRTLQLNFSPWKGLHYHLPVLFDYFHLSAVALTVHATLVALHQPYINTPRSSKPWLGSSKFRTHTINNTSMESVFQSGTKCGGSSPNKFAQARLLHQNVCEVLLEAHQNLQAAFKELLLLLPQWQQIQNSQHRNATQRLKKLCDSAKLMDVEEDFTARANSDVAQLCAENIVQWQNFLTSVSGKAVIHQHLAKKHHALRVRRFAEAFFVVDNPRHSAAGCYDANYQNYLVVSELARRSKYLVTLPPLPVHCVALDGDQTTMPIIFEDQYQDTLEFARRRSVAAGRKAGSDPFLSGKLSSESSPKPGEAEDCSCGIAQILESRSGSRTGGHVTGGHVDQATRSPQVLPARHSKSLDQLRVGVGQFATMPSRGSERVGGVGGEKRGKEAREGKEGCERQQGNAGGRRRLPYSSRSTVDLAQRRDVSPPPPSMDRSTTSGGGTYERRRADSGGDQRARSPRKHYEYQQYQPPRPLSEPQNSNASAHTKHHHCRSSDESERRRRIDRSDTAPSGPGPGLSPGLGPGPQCTQFPRSNSTQIFPPTRQDLDIIFHHSTLILSRNKDRDRDRELRERDNRDRPVTPNYRSDHERRRRQLPQHHDGLGVPPGYGRTSGPPHHRPERNISTFPRHGQSHNQMRTGKCASTSKDEHACPVKNSSISSRYKSCGGSSREPIVTSSSTDSESLPNGAASHSHSSSGGGNKRLHSSASVPHHLARGTDGLRHVRSASSVLDELFPLNPTASESLPNLAQPDVTDTPHHVPPVVVGRAHRPQHQTHRRHFSGGAIGSGGIVGVGVGGLVGVGGVGGGMGMIGMGVGRSLSTSASTSSLTSERSGWVSSHSVSEISSPEEKGEVGGNTGVTVNGDQLRSRLYELVSNQQHPPKERSSTTKHKLLPNTPNPPPGYGRTSADGPILDSGSIDHQDIINGRDVDNVDVTLALLDDGKEFIANIYGYAAHSEERNNGIVKTHLEHPYIKKELPQVPSTHDSGKDPPNSSGYEEVRLPPPKQFRDVPLPPEPFRDPSPGPETKPIISSTESTTPSGTGPSPAIDNLLYHVYESIQDDIKKSKSNTDLADKIEDFLATEDLHHHKLPTDEVHQLFAKAREEFKGQLNFSGMLYSDLPSFASTLPYFHISDEYRIFSPEGMHLIVCVHGLDGNSADLRLVKTYLELGLPGAHLEFLMSERNQGDTFSDFDTMTDRLVGEILYHMDSCGMRPSRISFVGHSLGNIIIRSALTRPQMKPLLSRLHTFLSLSGPHLGTLYNSSGLVNMGMWFMQKWKKSGSLLQLCLRDASDVRQSFLYRLSQKSTLHHFKNVLLCGSSQDRYVPLHSARLELCKAAIRDSTSVGCAYREMVHNVVSPMLARRALTLVRYDVHHALPHTANALIGRAAHIAVLDSELFIEKFLVVAALKYVPLHSARLELCKAAIRDSTSVGCAYREMVHNVVSPMLARRALTLVRYDVHHALPHTANALIGRAAHIAVLDSELFIEKFLVVAALKYFR